VSKAAAKQVNAVHQPCAAGRRDDKVTFSTGGPTGINMKKRNFNRVLSSLAVLAMCGQAMAVTPAPTSWELAGQINPFFTSVWSYGWKPNSLSQPQLFMPATFPPGMWQVEAAPGQIPLVAGNLNWNSTIWNGLNIAPHSMVLHPGAIGQRATVSFTAPAPAQYRVSGQFYGLDDSNPYGTHTSVRLVKASATNPLVQTLYSNNVTVPGQGQASFTSKLVMLKVGERIDFDVGAGPGNYYYFGSTGLHAVVERAGNYCDPAGPPCD
jgi:hypothetical protein